MQDTSADRLAVCLVDAALAAADLTAAADSLSVVAVDDVEAAREWAADVSVGCFVTGGLEAVRALTDADGTLPVIVFADPADGVTERALSAGATDVVAAVGPDRLARLGHRIESAVERDAHLEPLASAVEGSMDGMAVLDADGDYRYVNEAHADIYGFDRPEVMVGRNWRDCYDPDERERFEETVMPTMREAGQWRGEAVGCRADGETFPQELSLTRLEGGGIVCVVRDITDRADRRRQLREDQEFIDTVLDTLPDLFYVLDEAGTFQRWNDRLCDVTGYTDAELAEMSALEVIASEGRGTIAEAMSTIYRDGSTETRRAAIRTKQGERIPYEFNGTRLTDGDGEVIGLVGTGRDVTSQQLRRQWLSVLSNILQHNVRNQLSVVQANADYAASSADHDDVRTALDRIMEASRGLVEVSDSAQLAESVLREDRSARGEIDLVTAVEDAIADASLEDVTVRTNMPDSAPAIAVESVRVAVCNLVENARDESETITVRVTPGSDRTYVGVADDGPGIPDHEQRILTAGRETNLQHGTDIDLWLVNWIVTVSGGEVQFRSDAAGNGAEVVLSFPAA